MKRAILTVFLTLLAVSLINYELVSAQSYTPIAELETSDELYDVKWSPDGELLAVGGPWGAKIFDETLQEVAHLQGHVAPVVSVSWSPDSQLVATSGGIGDGTIRIWSRDIAINSFSLQHILTGLHEREFFIAWSPDGHWIASIGADSPPTATKLKAVTEIWNTTTWSLERNITMSYATVTRSLAWTADSSTVVGVARCLSDCPSGFANGVYFADVATGEVTRFIEMSDQDINAVAIHPTGGLLVSSSLVITRYDLLSLQRTYKFSFQRMPVDRIDWNPNGDLIVFGYDMSTGGVIETSTGLVLGLPDSYKGGFTGLDWHPDGYRFAGVARYGLIQIWDTRTLPAPSGTPIGTPFAPQTPTPILTPMATAVK